MSLMNSWMAEGISVDWVQRSEYPEEKEQCGPHSVTTLSQVVSLPVKVRREGHRSLHTVLVATHYDIFNFSTLMRMIKAIRIIL